MARYDIEITRTAEKQLRKLAREDQERVVRAILALADDPFPRGSRKLSGLEDVFRIRVGRCRVIYGISGKELIIIILKTRRRRAVYR